MARRKERAWQSPKPSPPIPQRAPQKAPVDWKRHIYAVLAMWVLALAAYSNSFGGELAFDSKVVIGDDPRIRAATSKNVDEIWSKGYWYNNADTSLYRPLTTLTCLLNYSILGNGARPAGYHWINFLLHSANVLLVYLLGLIVFRDTARSIALAALWAAHPVLTECVTNIVGRADLLAGFGVLAGWLCHVKALSAPGARKAAWLAGLAAASAIGIFSKESGVVLIPLMLVYDLTFRKAELRASIPGYVAAVLPVAAFLYRRSEVLATLPAGLPLFVVNPLTGLSFLASRLTAIQVIGRYLLLIVWPQRLSYDYSYNQIPLFHGTFDRWADWATLLALAVCLAAAGLAAVWYRRNRPGFFFLAVFFMALAPVGNIVLLIGTIMAERLLYLPALGLLGCLVWAIYAGTDRIRERWPAAAIQPLWIVGLLCLALAVRTHARNSDWETGYGLFASGAVTAPNSYKTRLNRAVSLFERDAMSDQAVAELERCLGILKSPPLSADQEDPGIYSNAAAIYGGRGDAVKRSGAPDAAQLSRAWYEKAMVVLRRGLAIDQARAVENEEANVKAGRPRAIFGVYEFYRELGKAYIRLGEPEKAIEPLDHASLIRPNAEIFQVFSEAYAAMHDSDGAAVALMEGQVIDPDQRGSASELVDLYKKMDPSGCAVTSAGGGNSLNIECPLVHRHLCAGVRRMAELYDRRYQPMEARRTRITGAQSFGCPAQ